MKDNWRTPPELFDRLSTIFSFTLDPAADHKNHLTKYYYCDPVSFDDLVQVGAEGWESAGNCLGADGLAGSWVGHRVFLNPPYSRGQLAKWLAKASTANAFVCCLIPVDPSTKWWQTYVTKAKCIEYLPQRVKYIDPDSNKPIGTPTFASALVYFW